MCDTTKARWSQKHCDNSARFNFGAGNQSGREALFDLSQVCILINL